MEINSLLYFWLFLKASLLSFGGLGNLPFLHQDLLSLGWATENNFIDAIAVGQLSPGPSGLWSISLGYLTHGWWGWLLALTAITIPPLLSLVINDLYERIAHRSIVKDFSRGLMLGVIGMSLGVTWSLAQIAVKNWVDILIVFATILLALSQKVPIVVIFLMAGLAGYLIYA